MSYQSHTLPSPRGAAEQAEHEILIAVRAVAPEIDEMIRAEPLPEGWLPGCGWRC
ncbi:hypothetical protein QEZ40_006418 [Streptomyces katrae]|uniref:Uncharacterized protein n=1 Tax=Streptomyces katrae TaxID=68223 RepID=A0ABT7H3W2_9ACTN|nr:hypothetical protein [Streptomyces katrae]MDK9500590.1 hypothetical protein [Streptomyces katrae]